MTYDALDRVIKTVTPAPSSGITTTTSDQTENGGYVTLTTYDNLGNLKSVTDGLNNATSFDYDALNRLVRIAQPNPVSGASYDSTVAFQANRLGWAVTTTDPAGHTVTVQADALGRPVATRGDTVSQSVRYWTDGTVRSSMQMDGTFSQLDYDARGRLISAKAPAISSTAAVTSYAYSVDGLLNSITDPLSRVTSYSYDAGGRNTRITQPDPDGTGPLAATYSNFAYDGLGNLLQSSDALGHATSYSYDAWRDVL